MEKFLNITGTATAAFAGEQLVSCNGIKQSGLQVLQQQLLLLSMLMVLQLLSIQRLKLVLM
jgi:hypothetical protein